MARHKFTVRYVESIPAPATGRTDYWDGALPGFGLRVTPASRKTWTLIYRRHGRQRRLTLGTYPLVGLADARIAATAALRAVVQGGDPAAAKMDERTAETFEELATLYLEKHAKQRKRSWVVDRRTLKRDLLPKLGHIRAAAVTRRDIIGVLDTIVSRNAPIGANRCLEIVRRIFNWAIERDILTNNPAARIPPPGDENARERVLNDDEIRALWAALGADDPRIAARFKLMLLTAARGGEVRRMRWADLDLGAGWWTIPAEFSKNGRAHRVPLSPHAIDIVRGLAPPHPEVPESPWTFPGRHVDTPTGANWRQVGRIRKRAGLANFGPHDLRRTAASLMTGMGISRLTVSKILNHVDRGPTAVYDRHSYDAEKRAALDSWARRLEEIIARKPGADDKVVQLRSA